MKRFFIILSALLICFSVTAIAQTEVNIDAGKDFFEFHSQPEKVASILKVSNEELQKTIADSGILFLAVNETNTKQIQLSSYENEFSQKVKNLSYISDDNIKSLLPQITGIENINGSIVKLNSQKFVNIILKSENEDDPYILTQYFTVADGKIYTLTFYNTPNEDTEYIENVFYSLSSDSFLNDTATQTKGIRVVIIIATILISAISLILVISIIKDMISNTKRENEPV